MERKVHRPHPNVLNDINQLRRGNYVQQCSKKRSKWYPTVQGVSTALDLGASPRKILLVLVRLQSDKNYQGEFEAEPPREFAKFLCGLADKTNEARGSRHAWGQISKFDLLFESWISRPEAAREAFWKEVISHLPRTGRAAFEKMWLRPPIPSEAREAFSVKGHEMHKVEYEE